MLASGRDLQSVYIFSERIPQPVICWFPCSRSPERTNRKVKRKIWLSRCCQDLAPYIHDISQRRKLRSHWIMASLVRYVQPGGMHSKDETEMSSGCSCSFHVAADGFLYQFEQQCLACAPLQVISANTKHWCRSLWSLIWGWVKTHGEWTSIGSAMTIWGTVWDAVTIGLDPRGTRSDLVQVCLGVPSMLQIMMLYVMDTSGIGLRWFLWKLNFIETNAVFARMIVFIDNNDT